MSQQHWGALIGGLVGGVFLCWIYLCLVERRFPPGWPHWHTWTNWSEPATLPPIGIIGAIGGGISTRVIYQDRKCETCDLVQRRLL